MCYSYKCMLYIYISDHVTTNISRGCVIRNYFSSLYKIQMICFSTRTQAYGLTPGRPNEDQRRLAPGWTDGLLARALRLAETQSNLEFQERLLVPRLYLTKIYIVSMRSRPKNGR